VPASEQRRRRAIGQWPWLLPAILCAAGAVAPPALLLRLNDGAGDLLRRAEPWSHPDPRIAIVDVDERSLAALGQWPWRRDRLGALVDRLRESGARTIALDLVFGEPDRTTTAGADGGVDESFADTLWTPAITFVGRLSKPGIRPSCWSMSRPSNITRCRAISPSRNV